MKLSDRPLLAVAGRLAGRLGALFLVALFVLSGTASATNWIYLQRQEGTRFGPGTEYIDVDSVVKDDDKVVYWTIWVFDETVAYDGTKKILWKQEALLSGPPRHRNVKMYQYNNEDVEIRNYLKPMGFIRHHRM